jgi:hypothetical protein
MTTYHPIAPVYLVSEEIIKWSIVAAGCVLLLTAIFLIAFYCIVKHHLNGRLNKIIKTKYTGTNDDNEIDEFTLSSVIEANSKETP